MAGKMFWSKLPMMTSGNLTHYQWFMISGLLNGLVWTGEQSNKQSDIACGLDWTDISIDISPQSAYPVQYKNRNKLWIILKK